MITFFKWSELTKTDTNITNQPSDIRIIENLIDTARYLDMLRKNLGMPIIVNSCYRSKEVNEKIGGVNNSWHCQGLAADIKCKDMNKLEQLLDAHISELDEYGKYYDKHGNLLWFHIGLGPLHRGKTFVKYVG